MKKIQIPSGKLVFKNRSGFTLIELIVVIVIICILAAIAYPVMADMKKRSHAVTSMNNLKFWGSALNRSLADYNGEMPYDGQKSLTNIALDDPTSWFNRLPPYMGMKPLSDPSYLTNPPKPGDKSAWINPAVPKDAAKKFLNPPMNFLFCYSMNYFLSYSSSDNNYKTQPMSRLERPNSVVFMAETADKFANCNPKYIRPFFGDGDPYVTLSKAKQEDLENGAHFLFCDGHVSLIKRKDYTKPEVTDNTLDISTVHLTFVPYQGAESSE